MLIGVLLRDCSKNGKMPGMLLPTPRIEVIKVDFGSPGKALVMLHSTAGSIAGEKRNHVVPLLGSAIVRMLAWR